MKHLYGGWTPESTETFRWASGKSPKGLGFNLQTEPKQFRWLHPAPPGRIYGQKDLKQAEARLVAHFAVAKRLLEIFADPTYNLYIVQGEHIFEKKIKKDTPLYTLCKSVIHASHYDEGPYKMAWDTGLSIQAARKFQANYHKANPEIKQWHEKTVKELLDFGRLTTPYFNRKRDFFEALFCYKQTYKLTTNQRKDAIAWRPQSIPPDIVSMAMRLAREQLGDEVWFHHHGHDSTTWSTPADNELFRNAESVIDKAMDIDIPINGLVLNIPRDTQVGYSVGDLMDYEGSIPTEAAWEKWREKRVKGRRANIMEGVYGTHI